MAREPINPADVDLIDGDNFSPDERAAFAEMQDDGDGGGGTDGGQDGAADAGADGMDGAAGADAGDQAAAGAAPGKAGAKGGAAAAAAAGGAAADGADADAADGDGADDDEEDGKVGPDGRPKKGRRVSARKYLTEKERADKLDADLRTEREKFARGDERLRILSEALTKPKVDPAQQAQDDDPEPDEEKDVFEWIKWSKRERERTNARIDTLTNTGRAQDADKSLVDSYTGEVARYSSTPEGKHFNDAYQYLMASRFSELALANYGVNVRSPNARKLTPNEIAGIKRDVQMEERGLAKSALQQQISPAEQLVQIAMMRGWQPPADDAGGGAAGQNGGKAPGALDAAAAAAGKNGGKAPAGKNGAGTVAEEIERIKNGSDASISLSDGGGSPANPMTVQKLAEMPQAEFDALMDRMDPDEFQALVEGRA